MTFYIETLVGPLTTTPSVRFGTKHLITGSRILQSAVEVNSFWIFASVMDKFVNNGAVFWSQIQREERYSWNQLLLPLHNSVGLSFPPKCPLPIPTPLVYEVSFLVNKIRSQEQAEITLMIWVFFLLLKAPSTELYSCFHRLSITPHNL